MIDVTEFTDKLDKLREYMELFIEDKLPGIIHFDINALPSIPFEKCMEIYQQSGMFLFHSNFDAPTFTKYTFEEWLQYNPHNLLESPSTIPTTL